MFETFNSAEIFRPKALSPDGERLWSYAQINIHVPWFYVEYSVDHGDCKTRSVLLLGNLEQLLDISNRPDFEITQAHIVTPRHINKTDDWQMDRLKKVLRATRKTGRTETPVIIYVLSDGREMRYSLDGGKTKPKHYETVFSQ